MNVNMVKSEYLNDRLLIREILEKKISPNT